MKKLISCLLLFSVYQLAAMEKEQSEDSDLVVYAIPGQNGHGSESGYIENIFGDGSDIVQVSTPQILPDLGQAFCENHLENALMKKGKSGVVYATSQGTATALNYFSKPGNSKKVKALVLEAALASGNSAIYHTATGPLMGMKYLESVPCAYYIAPYLASFMCLGYRPGGQQAIKSIDTIPTDMPIIIIHSKKDMQLPFDGACALYYRLRENGNDNVYFIQPEGVGHIQILSHDSTSQLAVKKILDRHLKGQEITMREQQDLSHFQPDPAQFKKHYDALIAKEKRHTYLERVLTLGIVTMAAKYVLGYFNN